MPAKGAFRLTMKPPTPRLLSISCRRSGRRPRGWGLALLILAHVSHICMELITITAKAAPTALRKRRTVIQEVRWVFDVFSTDLSVKHFLRWHLEACSPSRQA